MRDGYQVYRFFNVRPGIQRSARLSFNSQEEIGMILNEQELATGRAFPSSHFSTLDQSFSTVVVACTRERETPASLLEKNEERKEHDNDCKPFTRR